MISVIIPTYNRCDRLPKALDAVCAQDVDELEVIVVDNNSSDATAEVVRNYPDERVLYTLCTRQGTYQALNHGFALAKGEYLTWTSDDNWYHPGALKDMVQVLETTDADFVYSDYVAFDEATDIGVVVSAPESSDLDRHCTVGPCFLYHWRVYDLVGDYSLRYRYAADYDYWLKVRRAGFNMQPMSGSRYTFTYHSGSATRTRVAVVSAETIRVRLAHGCYPRLWNRPGDPGVAAEGLRHAYCLLRHRYFFDAVMLAVQAVLHRPLETAFWRRCGQIMRWAIESGRLRMDLRRFFGLKREPRRPVVL